jgi:hypothetical protein
MKVVDALEFDGLTDALDGVRRQLHQDGKTGYGLDRAIGDAWGASSHEPAKAHAAFHTEEIAPAPLLQELEIPYIAKDDGVGTGRPPTWA